MIRTRKDLKFYIEEDGIRNGFRNSYVRYLLYLVIGTENAHVFHYLRVLRYCEFHMNNRGLIHKFMYIIYKVWLRHLEGKYLIKLSPNIAGYGLRITHLSGGGGYV